jgi:copper chaperone CopZ
MRKIMNNIKNKSMSICTVLMTAAMISLLSVQVSAEQATQSTVFTVNGMVCAFCAQGIEKKLSAMPEVQAVHVSLEEKVVVVEAKSGEVLNAIAITAEIKDAGYDVTKVEAVEKKKCRPLMASSKPLLRS